MGSVKAGHNVLWASHGRSPETRARAERFRLRDVGTLTNLCRACDLIISVCPPHAAGEVAGQLLDQPFAGLYLDANAISPQRTIRIGERLGAHGISFVDGGIVGGPAWEPGQTWLYLSGDRALDVAQCFSGGPLETAVIGREIGKASALKMCYASWTKGSTALLCAIVATAHESGVWPELARQWERDWPGFDQKTVQRVRLVTAKAWRFEGEMYEISETFSAAGLPGGFHAAAAEIYQRISHLKGSAETPELEQVLAALVER